MPTSVEHGTSAAFELTGRIDHRLSFVFGSLFILVLMVGGISLYLLGSLLLKSEEIARESEQVHLAERMHRTLQDFFAAVQRAQREGLSGTPSGVQVRAQQSSSRQRLTSASFSQGRPMHETPAPPELLQRWPRLRKVFTPNLVSTGQGVSTSTPTGWRTATFCMHSTGYHAASSFSILSATPK